ncbi:hypothetical protein, partial [Ensifer sp. Root142]|uniref:hypothetical protein n=1 Tax=Ensifer sp. Root142 TaxID=1736461 RepID=UPI001AECE860
RIDWVEAIKMPGTTWRKGDMPEDGSVIFVRVVRPYRFKIHKSNSEGFRHGKKGRWQQMNEFGGWVIASHLPASNG